MDRRGVTVNTVFSGPARLSVREAASATDRFLPLAPRMGRLAVGDPYSWGSTGPNVRQGKRLYG